MKTGLPAATLVPPQPSAQSVAARIRRLRKERGWSLADVERLSRGSLKAVVLGSYERGDRALTLKRAIEIANLFSVPLHHLLSPPEKALPAPTSAPILVDLRQVHHLMEAPTRGTEATLQMLYAFVAWISGKRGDWNGEVMSLRAGDLTTLSLMTLMTESEISTWLAQKKLLITERDHP